MLKATLKLVLVEWEDSHHRPGWTSDEANPKPLPCRSVGWLVAQNASAITLSANVSVEETPQRCGDMTIPRRCIVRITKLR